VTIFVRIFFLRPTLIRVITSLIITIRKIAFLSRIETIDAEFHSLGKEPSQILLNIISGYIPAEGNLFLLDYDYRRKLYNIQ